jgi:hypothetical protein
LKEDDVVKKFPGRGKPFSEEDALEHLRRVGPIETTITDLAEIWGWSRSVASRTLTEWSKDGKITKAPGLNGKTTFTVRTPVQESEEPAHADQNAAHAADEQQQSAARSCQLPAPIAEQPQPILAWCRWAASVGVLAWCRWILGVVLIVLSVWLYISGLNLNAAFWPSLDPTGESKTVLRRGGIIIETVNYVVPSAIALGAGRFLWGFWSVTTVMGATAEASYVRSALGAGEVSRKHTIEERDRLHGVVNSVAAPVSDASAADARERVKTAGENRKSDCRKSRSLDLETCAKAKATLVQAEADLRQVNATHDEDVRTAERRHQEDVAKAKDALKDLPVISADKNPILAGITALVPVEVPEAWANRIVAALWVALFSFGPCILLRRGLARTKP